MFVHSILNFKAPKLYSVCVTTQQEGYVSPTEFKVCASAWSRNSTRIGELLLAYVISLKTFQTRMSINRLTHLLFAYTVV